MASKPQSDKSKSRIGRGVEKHNFRMGTNEDTGKANDPNYQRKWKRMEAVTKRGRSGMRTKVGQAITKARRSGGGLGFGGGGLGFGGKAMALLNKASGSNWWNKV
jgi:hypothetical protein